MTTAIAEEHVYRYVRPSAVRAESGELGLDLATSGGCASHPWLAEGFVTAPQAAARALLLVANVAGTRFWMPPNMVAAAIAAADPVVTAGGDGLRFESFSQCCGVYARFDLDRSALEGRVTDEGTTNIDVNPPLRSALARIGSRDPLHLSVGSEELAVDTLGGRVVEKKVPLPERWVRGFAEVSVATCALEPAFELANAGARRFLQQLPTGTTRGVGWVVPSGSGARLSTRWSAGAVSVGGIERLRPLRDIAPFILSMTAFGRTARTHSGETACSVWSIAIEGGHLSVALSPEPARGFSGEGGLLHALSTRTDTQLEQAMAGRLGYDLHRAAWFARDLPFSRESLERPGGRLAGARQLVMAGAVDVRDDGLAGVVSSSANEYRTRLVDETWRCTCPWWAKHGDDRGPCKHILGTIIASAHL